jgi:FkbM family methyltransferase
VVPDLVIDVGAHDGSDVASYLAQGYRVLAIEANPKLAHQLTQLFADAIAAGRLTVLAAGVHYETGQATFYISEHDELSSFVRSRATEGGVTAVAAEVPVVSMREVFATHGVPHYLKVDIEGMDDVCIDALDAHDLPTYLSVELTWNGPAVVRRLTDLGYRRFKVIHQRGHKALTPRTVLLRQTAAEPDHTSGSFGEAADGPWLSPRMTFGVVALLAARRAWQGATLWHDLHASRR